MRHLRPYLALLTIAAIAVACASSPGSSSGATGSQGGGASQPAASAGGGGGAKGSITYEITGAYQASGEIPFVASASKWIASEGGWLANFKQTSAGGAYILLNTQTKGQILNFGDANAVVTTTSVAGSPFDCTFNITANDSSGLKGSVQCTAVPVITTTTTTEAITVDISANWDVHP